MKHLICPLLKIYRACLKNLIFGYLVSLTIFFCTYSNFIIKYRNIFFVNISFSTYFIRKYEVFILNVKK